jgi:hypothetical protein
MKKGLIGCITIDLVNDDRQWWRRTGFASRLLPIAFRHSDKLQGKVLDFILECSQSVWGRTEVFKMPRSKREVLIPEKLHRVLRLMVKKKQRELAEAVPYRVAYHYKAMLKAHAILRNSRAVGDQDVSFLEQMDDYVRFIGQKEI